MDIKQYRKACNYAMKLVPYGSRSHKDIVHDAYLDYYYRTKQDLFKAPNKTIIITVRNHYYNSIRKDRFMYKGEYFRKRYYSLNDDFSVIDGITQGEYLEAKFSLYSDNEVLANIDANQKLKLLQDRLSCRQRYFLDRFLQGYSQIELLREGESGVSDGIRRIREKYLTVIGSN